MSTFLEKVWTDQHKQRDDLGDLRATHYSNYCLMGQNAPYELPVKIFGTLFIYLLHGNYLSMNHKKELKFSMPICLFMNLHGIKNFNYLLTYDFTWDYIFNSFTILHEISIKG